MEFARKVFTFIISIWGQIVAAAVFIVVFLGLGYVEVPKLIGMNSFIVFAVVNLWVVLKKIYSMLNFDVVISREMTRTILDPLRNRRVMNVGNNSVIEYFPSSGKIIFFIGNDIPLNVFNNFLRESTQNNSVVIMGIQRSLQDIKIVNIEDERAKLKEDNFKKMIITFWVQWLIVMSFFAVGFYSEYELLGSRYESKVSPKIEALHLKIDKEYRLLSYLLSPLVFIPYKEGVVFLHKIDSKIVE